MDNPTIIPFNDLKRLYARHAACLETAVTRVMASGWWISGAAGDAFATAFADYIGAKHCIPVANGTDALEIALRLVGQPGQEIVTVANAGGYTSTAAQIANLVPVFADIEPDTLLMSIRQTIAKLNSNTAAVVATHLFGNVVDVPKLRQAMREVGFGAVPIVEDCAQAHGATHEGQKVGAFGDLSAFSFYPTKNLGALGDAGAVLTNDDGLAAAARQIKQYGWDQKYRVARAGGRNSRMDEIQAAALSALLQHLPALNDERNRIRANYARELPKEVQLILAAPGAVTHLVVVQSDQRDALREHLGERGVATDIHYPVLDCDQPGWPHVEKPDLPISRRARDKILSLPCFIGMTDHEQANVWRAINEFFAA